jgi:translation initiation factor IF-1
MTEMESGTEERAGGSGRATADGIVTELLPSQLAKVSLDGRHLVTVHLGNPVQRNYIRVLVGDRVRVALMPADRTRGRILAKL